MESERDRPRASVPKAGSPGRGGGEGGTNGPTGGVLLVEDNPEFRALLKKTLLSRFSGISVFEAGGAEEGLRKIRDCLPRIAFLDVRLPDGSGLALARTVCREHPHVCVIVCTAHDLPEYAEAARRAGVAHFLVKQSLDLEHVLTLVEEALLAPETPPEPSTPAFPR
ncbi:MAG: response regulator transcription factor [Deltaproteobacteria bacterium]|nr:response regulator transcription factor [Deltaproteobacteria bacterium]